MQKLMASYTIDPLLLSMATYCRLTFCLPPPPPPPQFVESRVRYPEWAQFVGSVIILSSVLFIPIILIVKLIAHQEARDEGLEFFRRQKQDALDFFQDVR